MHGLLAVAALHYAYNHPEERKDYIITSTQHQNFALQHFATALNDINEENSEAYFFLASLVFLLSACSIANPQDRDEPMTPGDVVQSFVFLQGVKEVMTFSAIQKWKQGGPLAPLLQPWVSCSKERYGPFRDRLDKLADLARELPTSSDIINIQSSCLLAIESLRNTYHLFMSDESHKNHRYIWRWPFALSQIFLDLLRGNHPIALIILAHYAALAMRYEKRAWPFAGWSQSVLAMVHRVIEPEWVEWIKWPQRCVHEGKEVDEVAGE
jgi:hypothetical protein